ncbi:MAG: ATP-dependent 6-phosphofructokinase [Actinomycetota bacterium]|nr:ATP-dependent 6-phosphofructokinase [Actinomycetota bacterium]
MIKKIGVLTGGGDSSAINAAIRAIKMKAVHYGYDLFGIRNGWEGLIEGKGFDLIKNGVSGTLPMGGTYLGTSRTNPFKIEQGVEKVRANIEKFNLDALITIGGDDTNGVTLKLAQFGIKGVGIPQTIDNDIAYSDYSIGFDSALEVVTDAIDRLHTTASSHHRIMIVEVMGRDAGWLALHGGLAGGADVILIPEVPFDYDDILEVIDNRQKKGKEFSIIVVAEGAKPKNLDQQVTASGKVDNFGHVQLGGIGDFLAKEIEKRSGHECRVTVLGHTQRGGRPTAFDRILATRLGAKAVDLVHQKDFGKMVCFKDNKVIAVPLSQALESQKPMDMELYQLSRLFH